MINSGILSDRHHRVPRSGPLPTGPRRRRARLSWPEPTQTLTAKVRFAFRFAHGWALLEQVFGREETSLG